MTIPDIVERAKNWAADAKTAHVYGVGVRADLSTIGMVKELIVEVERLRSAPARAQVLAEQWEAATTFDGRPDFVARGFGKMLRRTLSGPTPEATE